MTDCISVNWSIHQAFWHLFENRYSIGTTDFPYFVALRDKLDFHVSKFQSLMGSFDYHLNVLLAFETRAEKSLPAVPPAKLEEMTRRFVTATHKLCDWRERFPLMLAITSLACHKHRNFQITSDILITTPSWFCNSSINTHILCPWTTDPYDGASSFWGHSLLTFGSSLGYQIKAGGI